MTDPGRRVAPGGTLGILGGGQLGRMTALAARPLGYRVHVLDPDPACAAAPVVERVIAAPFDDAAAAARLAADCDAVTLEIEKIGAASLAAVEQAAPLRPAASVLHVVQDRVRQKRWLAAQGFPVGPFREAADEARFVAAAQAFGGRVFAKSSFGGYDGRGQARLAGGEEDADDTGRAARTQASGAPDAERIAATARAAWAAMGGAPCVVEQALELEAELSVLVARGVEGDVAVYPCARNHHEERILAWSVLPGAFPPEVERDAQAIAQALAEALGLVGVLCVELFLTRGGSLLVNELAPRPHNSYHASLEACATSQFEQLVRAACGLPLGATDVLRPVAIVNLLGGLWQAGPPSFERALERPGVRLHLYGKGDPRPGRKMGHLSAFGTTPEDARRRAQEAYARLLAPRT